MKAILFKEFRLFFGSPIGYLVIALFLLITGLFLWVFEGDYNILNSGFADLAPFFTIAPWILLFLIPSVTMRSFADEKKQGTIELLLTKPIRLGQIVIGKSLGAFLLILIAIIPTLVYIKMIYDLGLPEGNLDFGSTLGSYFGLLFLIGSYTSIGVYTSTLSDNQIVAFLTAVLVCFLFYFGFQGISTLTFFGNFNDFVASLGMDYHYKSISRGVIDTRDLIYFMSVIFFFYTLTVTNLKKYKK
ncbi:MULTISPECIES: gliding motility-associated ABC transporter permease subunit GldF [Flavobacterium]|uniref:Gliding motility-associated ABC transporter permease subunit GldF n=1 Tax=Flavobacterium covae TaxID=2906076 RepID=A0ABW8PFG3_9FLAO|nr:MULTISPECIES: gliding motility-associated ABC transporter permease subunit GldF [Flavobacterium]OXA74724.1 gliding motility-associated ABC transporter permease subunit GldF [Flavobacterium columnare NBRC 100251 = ATCC 23463]AMA49781.1 gliding motility-associated ABC transporter permease subunit GldF [Flavobacterium covae]AND64693.1 gliding motility-associated ABC transporter permease subunit GldF [Flavobacterium covae]MCJ1805645.1 gliding motility-associated ABC transporter permease subunit 